MPGGSVQSLSLHAVEVCHLQTLFVNIGQWRFVASNQAQNAWKWGYQVQDMQEEIFGPVVQSQMFKSAML